MKLKANLVSDQTTAQHRVVELISGLISFRQLLFNKVVELSVAHPRSTQTMEVLTFHCLSRDLLWSSSGLHLLTRTPASHEYLNSAQRRILFMSKR